MRADERLARLEARRTDPTIAAARGLNEVYKHLAEDSAIKYAVGAMQPIDPEYTSNTIAEGKRVQAQLSAGLHGAGIPCEFRFQGSVTNDTHIKAHSDIDLVVLFTLFHTVEPPQPVVHPYSGDTLADLVGVRRASQQILTAAFPAVTVDASGGKALTLTGGSLRRKIDVVTANWWNTVAYGDSGLETFRGIQILDVSGPSTIKNKPFLHNHRIDEKDRTVSGAMRKVTRLLKSLKYDAETPVRMSSYDIASVAYSIPSEWLATSPGQDLLLLDRAAQWVQFLCANDDARNALRVPNNTRTVFGVDGATKESLLDLHREVQNLREEVAQRLARSFRRLEAARIMY